MAADFASVPEALALAIRAISEGSRALAAYAAVSPREGDVAELERRAAAVRTLRRLRDEAMHPSGGTDHNHAWLSDGPPGNDTLCHGCGLRYGDWKAQHSGSRDAADELTALWDGPDYWETGR